MKVGGYELNVFVTFVHTALEMRNVLKKNGNILTSHLDYSILQSISKDSEMQTCSR